MRITQCQKALLISVSLIAVSLSSVQLAIAQNNPQAANSPRQGWAHQDGVFVLQQAKPITPQSVADRMMIEDAFYRWAIAYDEGNLDVIRALFTKDAIHQAHMASAEPVWVNRGPDAIIAAVERDRGRQSDQRRHAISNVVIDKLDAKHASAAAYGVVTVAGNGDLYLGATVLYVGELEKQNDGNWRFTKFVIGLDAYKPAPE